MKIKIYQIKCGHDLKFINYESTVKTQDGRKQIDRSIYDEVYEGEVDCISLSQIFNKFNLDHPADFKGHSLSVSDIIKTPEGLFFVDNFSFQAVDFAKPKVQLSGQDGNIFNLMALCSHALKKAGMATEATEMQERITSLKPVPGEKLSGYERALLIMMEYCDVN